MKDFNGESLLAACLRPETKGTHAEVVVHAKKTMKKARPLEVRESKEGIKIDVYPADADFAETDSRLKSTLWTRTRDQMGALVSRLEQLDVDHASLQLNLKADLIDAALTGLEIALYRYKRIVKGEKPKFTLEIKVQKRSLTKTQCEEMTLLGRSVNLARHLVSLPPNLLNPQSYVETIIDLFKGKKNVKLAVWAGERLKRERMQLLTGVGQGSVTPPYFVHISYRPRVKKAPIAFVGKGITFDSGGLDLKPASGMRLMKKDMGGSAAVVGVAHWAILSGLKQNLDFYLPLAENAVSDKSFRPGDVITARNGMDIEIHNTDAEGRLVLADALDVAATAKEKPKVIIDVATLTGAIKVALGSGLAGIFANDERLSASLMKRNNEVGDMSWVMPVFHKYTNSMNSSFADMVNAVDGFGGAVTAALFLEKFVKDIPWAHLDIYAWKDGPEGCFLESGGSGQSVLGLANWLSHQGR